MAQYPELLSTAFFVISLLTGAALVSLSLWMRSRSTQCLHWPSVLGVVTESRVEDSPIDMMKPVVRYRYAVDGSTFIGFRVTFSGYGVSRSAMVQLIAPYPEGSTVTVYYDPANPASSVLNNLAKSDWRYWLMFGIGFWLLAAFLALR